MKKSTAMKYRLIMFLGICCLLIPAIAIPQVFERSRHESKAWKVSKETSLEVSNKYGNIHLYTWDNDSIKINIDMQVKANKESKVDKIYDYIDFEFSDNKYYIIARTLFNQQSEFWAEVTDLASTFFSSGTKVQIDYSVYLPASVIVKIENKFGNIYTTDHKGKMSVILSNGDFKANDLLGATDLNISFGNASINSIEFGKLNLSYSDLELASAVNLTIESKSSTINIDKIGTLNINSKRDKYYINNLAVLSGKTSFSYLNLKSFSSDLTLNTDYGEVNLEKINSEFRMIDLTSSYTDILLKIPAKASYAVDISHSVSTVITAPENYSDMKSETVDKKADLYRTKGTAGNGPLKKGKVTINSRSGKITFREAL
jgi:hypothetical protein